MTNYKQSADFLSQLSIEQAAQIAHHGNPAWKSAGKILLVMAERHQRNDYNHAMDAQSVDDALYYIDAQDVAQYLVTARAGWSWQCAAARELCERCGIEVASPVEQAW